MKTLHLDIETFSEVDLGSAGVYRYAEHASTEVLCFAYAFDDEPVRLWKPGEPLPGDLVEHIKAGGELRAHNAAFERVVLNGTAGKKIGFPEIKIEQTVCTAAKMAASGLPRGLDDAAKALGVEGKAAGGRFEMLALSKPRKPTKGDPSTRWTLENAPEKYQVLYAYNIQDVVAERTIDEAVPDLIPSEQEIYHLDQHINQRGVLVDVAAVKNILHVVEQYKQWLAAECERLTADWLGDGLKPTQREKISEWIRANGWPVLADMQAETVKSLIRNEGVPECVKRVLAIYSTYNAKSVSKLQAMLDAVCADNRLRGMFLFHGAGPGRWSSLIVQLQNLMRPVIDDPTLALEAFATRDLEFCRMLFPEHDLMKVAGSCTRACLVASPGHDLIFIDFSGIEARVLPWFFDETRALEEFEKHDRGETPFDNYQLAYCTAFNLDPASVDWKCAEGKLKRQIGKVMVLFFGYEGGVSAFLTGVDTYGIDLQALTDAVLPGLPEKARDHGEWMWEHHRKQGVTKEQSIACDGLKFLWRQAHPRIRDGWKELKKAAELAVEFPGTAQGIPSGKIWFKVVEYRGRRWLHMRLPSGRDIKYYNPRWIEPRTITRPKKIHDGSWVDETVQIPGEFRYWGTDTDTRQWMELSTYGGKLCENGDQGYSSCLLRGGMRNLEAAGYPAIGTVHDEIIMEVPKGFGSLEEAAALMCKQAKHAAGLPLRAEGKRQEYYWK